MLKENNKKLIKNQLIYWDSYNNNDIDISMFSNEQIIKNINRIHCNYLSDKKRCSNLIKKLKLNKYYPKTYNNISEIKKSSNDTLFFIKEICSTGGKGVKCINKKELLNYKINENEIIQEGVTNIKLIDNKKFVIRAYIIIFNNNIYLSKYAWCMVHGKDYINNSLSHDIQINHVGYSNKKSKIKMYALHETKYSSYIYKIRDVLIKMKDLFRPLIDKSNKDYIIIGPDILITHNNEIQFIQFNTFPNLKHTENINKNVNEKMLFDLFKLVFLNCKSDTLLFID